MIQKISNIATIGALSVRNVGHNMVNGINQRYDPLLKHRYDVVKKGVNKYPDAYYKAMHPTKKVGEQDKYADESDEGILNEQIHAAVDNNDFQRANTKKKGSDSSDSDSLDSDSLDSDSLDSDIAQVDWRKNDPDSSYSSGGSRRNKRTKRHRTVKRTNKKRRTKRRKTNKKRRTKRRH
jgi:hypothetical protein